MIIFDHDISCLHAPQSQNCEILYSKSVSYMKRDTACRNAFIFMIIYEFTRFLSHIVCGRYLGMWVEKL